MIDDLYQFWGHGPKDQETEKGPTQRQSYPTAFKGKPLEEGLQITIFSILEFQYRNALHCDRFAGTSTVMFHLTAEGSVGVEDGKGCTWTSLVTDNK